jgi:hypothetical protein
MPATPRIKPIEPYVSFAELDEGEFTEGPKRDDRTPIVAGGGQEVVG